MPRTLRPRLRASLISGGASALLLLALAVPAMAQTGNPVLRNPSAMEPQPRSMAPEMTPAPAPARPMPQPPGLAPDGQRQVTQPLPSCTPPNCGTPSIMGPPVQ